MLFWSNILLEVILGAVNKKNKISEDLRGHKMVFAGNMIVYIENVKSIHYLSELIYEFIKVTGYINIQNQFYFYIPATNQ